MPSLTIQWRRLGPYHLARLRATVKLFSSHGWQVSALETARDDGTYDWQVEQEPTSFRRFQVFPDSAYEEVNHRKIYSETQRSLDLIMPDVVAVPAGYSTPDERACLAWSTRNNKPTIVMTNSKANDAPRNALREWGKQQIIRLYDAALTAGTLSTHYLKLLGVPKERIFHTYNAVDNAFFFEGAVAARTTPDRFAHLPGLSSDTPFFLTSNRFIAIKNLEALLYAYADYRNWTPNPWRLLLLGDGPLRLSLEEQSGEGVVFAGFQQIENLPAYYGLASAFIHPTLKDTWGLVVNEAMAAGLPVIVSEAAGCAPDLVTHGWDGFLFAPHDTEELTEHMLTIASYSEAKRKEMGARSQERIADYSPDAFAKGMWEAVQAAISHATGRRHSLLGRLILAGVQAVSRSHTSFHTVRD